MAFETHNASLLLTRIMFKNFVAWAADNTNFEKAFGR